jgi:hypothetical protein
MKAANRLPRARTDHLVIRELDDETLVYDTERDKAHCLNQTAALVWRHCDGKTTAREAVRSLQDTLGASVDADIIWLAVKQLDRFHLVEGTLKITRSITPNVGPEVRAGRPRPARDHVNQRADAGTVGKLR